MIGAANETAAPHRTQSCGKPQPRPKPESTAAAFRLSGLKGVTPHARIGTLYTRSDYNYKGANAVFLTLSEATLDAGFMTVGFGE
jgi:hypothetical protein